MSDLLWKDCSVKQLQGETIDTVPTQEHYVMWCNHTLRAVKGIGAGYIKQMIEALALQDDLIPMLVPAANLRADGTADYNSMEFKLGATTKQLTHNWRVSDCRSLTRASDIGATSSLALIP
eukprot:2767389-Rhodomonas_salina.1